VSKTLWMVEVTVVHYDAKGDRRSGRARVVAKENTQVSAEVIADMLQGYADVLTGGT